MGVQIYKNGSWTTPTLKINKNGAWVNVSSVKRYVNGEWTELLQTTPVGTFRSDLLYFMSTDTTYSYEITQDGTSVTCKINNATSISGVGTNRVVFAINKAGGFGATIKLKYTVTQTMTSSAYASSRWLKMDFTPMSGSLGMWYNYQPCTNITHEGTLTFDTAQQLVFLHFEAYSGNLTSTISDVYINDELVTFR